MPTEAQALAHLVAYARGYAEGDILVRDGRAFADERQDGEPVTRLLLVLDDPAGDTWDIDAVARLRRSLGIKATKLELPAVSITLIPKSESALLEIPPRR